MNRLWNLKLDNHHQYLPLSTEGLKSWDLNISQINVPPMRMEKGKHHVFEWGLKT